MQRSAQRRSPTDLRRRRVIAVGAVVLVVGAMLTVTQISNAGTRRWWDWRSDRERTSTACPSPSTSTYNPQTDLATSEDGVQENHAGDGQSSTAGTTEREARQRGRQWTRQCAPSTGPSGSGPTSSSSPGTGNGGNNGGNNGGGNNNGSGTVPPGGADGNNNGLQVLGRDCTVSQLEPHTGFQNGNQCVNTQFGEVSSAANNPSLLIVDPPTQVEVGATFQLRVSTRNLVRNRFLGAAVGGYYLESSFLNEDGLVRGHFHTACRLLQSADEAPDPEPAPAFFVATEDGSGGAAPDEVVINVSANATAVAGTIQCASWAGDGSHRIPMMERANQMPAFDSVRIQVG